MARATDWIDTLVSMSPASGGSSNVSLITGAAPINMRGVTLIRTIVSLSLVSTTVAGAWGVQQAQIAIGITSQEAFAAGVFPDPSSATDKPPRGWVYRTSAPVTQNGISTPVHTWVQADIRGARKIENGELFLIVDNDAVLGTAFQLRVTGIVRVLMKLP